MKGLCEIPDPLRVLLGTGRQHTEPECGLDALLECGTEVPSADNGSAVDRRSCVTDRFILNPDYWARPDPSGRAPNFENDSGRAPNEDSHLMPGLPRLGRLAALAALPAVGEFVSSTARSATARDLVRRGMRDPLGLVRYLAKPSISIDLMRRASSDPSVRQLVRAGLLFAPIRYWAIGQAAIWGARKVVRRPPGDSRAGPPAPPAIRNVTPPETAWERRGESGMRPRGTTQPQQSPPPAPHTA